MLPVVYETLFWVPMGRIRYIIQKCKEAKSINSEHWRIDAFELCCWRRLLRVPCTARRSNQSILKEISPEYSLEGLMLKFKLNTLATWCEELTRLKRSWWWERLRAGGEGNDRGWDGWMASPTRWTWVWASSGIWWWTGKAGVLQSMGSQRIGHDWATELNWEAKCNQQKHKKKWLAHVTWKSKRVVLISGTAGSKGSNAVIYIFSFLGSWLPFSASSDKDMLHITAKMTTSGSRCTSSFTVLELRRDTLYFLVSE